VLVGTMVGRAHFLDIEQMFDYPAACSANTMDVVRRA
jgi:hypothetical protein